MATITMKANQQVDVTIAALKADGTAAPLQNPLQWVGDGSNMVSIIPSPTDPMTATIRGNGTSVGTTTVTVKSFGLTSITVPVTLTSPITYATQIAVASVSAPIDVP